MNWAVSTLEAYSTTGQMTGTGVISLSVPEGVDSYAVSSRMAVKKVGRNKMGGLNLEESIAASGWSSPNHQPVIFSNERVVLGGEGRWSGPEGVYQTITVVHRS